ncbi:uncharacterized protein LOC123309666 [Coccinella septempunctata]|uniref:uncharacterized protein LOC123309666 n=1 Tax=Coccinella septempunctata TaxID=41139 RepID=UPI001D07DF25|nr:uncharacterized protein LOC123309666 [Coccinella septempunctata]
MGFEDMPTETAVAPAARDSDSSDSEMVSILRLLRKEKVDKLTIENQQMKSDFETLNSRLNDLEQASRMNNLEIQGVQERENENLFQIMNKVCSTLNIPVVEGDFERIHRVRSNSKYSPKDKPKNIIVTCSSRRLKDSILLANKRLRTQTNSKSSALSVEGLSNDIYINEHLTLANKILHKETREVARKRGIKFVWVRDGRVFARKTEASPILHIRGTCMLQKL